MKRLIILILTTLLICTDLDAGIYGKLTGIVVDQKGNGLIGATVMVVGTTRGTSINQPDGSFTVINIKAGTYEVKISYVGMNSKTIKDVVIKADLTTSLDTIILETSIMKTECIMVCSKKLNRKKTIGSKHTISMSEMQNRAGSGTITGVLTSNRGVSSGSGGVSIRGSRTSQLQIRVDGIDIAKPFTGCFSGAGEDFSTEEYDEIVENEYLGTIQNPLSTFSIDVDNASYSNMRRQINYDEIPRKYSIRTEEMINYFTYDYEDPDDDRPFAIFTDLSTCPWNKKTKLLRVALQGKRMETSELPANNLVFLLDVSGSMQSANKIDLVKKAITLLTKELREEDKISIVVYAGAAGCVLDPTDGSDKKTILRAIEKLEAGGSTNGGAGIKLAYKLAKENFIKEGNNRVILCTDGDFNVGVSSDGELVDLIKKERESGVFLTVLGFGMGNYKDSKLEKLADKGNGNYSYIDNEMEAKKVLIKEFSGTLFTIAKDVKIQIEFNPAKVAYYRLIGYENRLLAAEDFDNDKKDAGEIGAGHSVTAFYEIIPVSNENEEEKVNLKYQKNSLKDLATDSDELLTIKFRYKAPDADKSQLIEKVLNDKTVEFEDMDDDFRFAASVAEFSMLLRASEFRANSNIAHVYETAQDALSDDKEAYRAEFLTLVKKYESLLSDDKKEID